jgi:pimeloyl-ACP methyl ester carboxylesterase
VPTAPAGFTDRIVAGDPFQHRVFTRFTSASGPLHIYIEGDGRAWSNRTTVSLDPTPHHPLMLELMALDPGPSAYVGRPCYFGLAESAACEPEQWTNRRYSAEIVASLQVVIEKLLAEGRYEGVVLFGHSGGGTLATLLAARLAETRALVTIAANLDVAGWAKLHGYTPLEGSLDPARTMDFPISNIFQVHWLGSKDREVPPSLLSEVERRSGVETFRVRVGFTHECCWREIWPKQLSEVDAYLAAEPRRDFRAGVHLRAGLQENFR